MITCMDRVCIFIDGSNFYHALKEAGLPINVDFGKLAIELTGQRKHIHTYYYNAPLVNPRRGDPDFAERERQCRAQQRFLYSLRFVPNLTFRPGRLQRSPDGRYVEKGVDIMLAVDMLTLAFKDRYDVAILTTSDGDFVHAIETIKFETGKTVELRQVSGSKAEALIRAASEYHPIERDVIERCLNRVRARTRHAAGPT